MTYEDLFGPISKEIDKGGTPRFTIVYITDLYDIYRNLSISLLLAAPAQRVVRVLGLLHVAAGLSQILPKDRRRFQPRRVRFGSQFTAYFGIIRIL